MSSCPHGDQLPVLVLVWVSLIEVWDPSGVAEVFLLWKSDCGVAMRWGPEVLGPAHRPQAPHAPCHLPCLTPLQRRTSFEEHSGGFRFLKLTATTP